MTHQPDKRTIEEGIERDRESLASTIDLLQDRISVEKMAQEALGMIRSNALSYTRTIDRAVRNNPAAVALVSAGLVWMLLGPRPVADEPPEFPLDTWEDEGGAVLDNAEDAGSSDGAELDWSQRIDRLRSRAARRMRTIDRDAREDGRVRGRAAATGVGKVRDFAGERAALVKDLAAGMKDAFIHGLEGLPAEARDRVVAARERAYSVALRARRAADAATRESGRLVEDHPFVAGLAAAAFGAGLAAALPRTGTEDRMFGSESKRLMQEAANLLAQERERAARLAAGVAEEIRDGAKAAVDAVGEKVAETGKAVRDRALSETAGSDGEV